MDHRVRIAKDLFILNDYNTVNHLGQSSKFNQLLYPLIDKDIINDSTYITKTVSSGNPYYFYAERDYTFIPTGIYLTVRGSGTPSINPLTVEVAYELPSLSNDINWVTIGRNHPSSGFNLTPTVLNLSRMLSDVERSGINSIFHHQNRLSGVFSLPSTPTSESRHLGMFRLNMNDGDRISYFDMTFVGDETYTNYETGIYGVDQSYYYPTGIYGIGSDTFSWKTGSGTPVHYARELQVPPTGIGTDNEFIELFRANNDDEHLSLSFNCNEDSFQKVNRGILSLRAQYPHSGTYQSSWFNVLGYKCDKEHGGSNSVYINSYQDDRGVYNPRNHVIYGNGTTIWNSGWTNYSIPLSFINPHKDVSGIGGNYFNRYYDNTDVFKGIDLVVGPFPSGTRISSAELLLETEPSKTVPMHIAGGNLALKPSGEWYNRSYINSKLYGFCPSYYSESIFDVGYFKASGSNKEIRSLTSNASGLYTGNNFIFNDFFRESEMILYQNDPTYQYGGADKYFYIGSGDYINLMTSFNVTDDFSMVFVVPFFNDYVRPNGTIFLRGTDHSYYEFKLNISDVEPRETTLSFYDALDIEHTLTLPTEQPLIELGYSGNTLSGEFYLKNLGLTKLEASSDYSGYIEPRRKIIGANSFVGFNFTGCIQEWGASSSRITSEQSNHLLSGYWYYTNQLIASGNDINYMEVKTSYGSGISIADNVIQNVPYNYLDTEIYSLLWPHRRAYDNVDVCPSSICLRMVTELNTSHTGVILKANLRGATTNNNLSFSKCIPSGTKQTYDFYPDLTYNNQFNKWPVIPDDDNYYLNLDVNYNDHGNYYGELKIYSIQMLVDGWVSPQTGTNTLNLYMSGIPRTHESLDLYVENLHGTEELDLYIYGHSTTNDDVDLFMLSNTSNKDVHLYTEGHALSSGNLDLFLNCASGVTSATDYPSGVPLFIEGIYREDNNIPLYTKGLDPPNASGSTPLWIWSTTNPGIFSSLDMHLVSEYDNGSTIPLYIDGGSDSINDYINLSMNSNITSFDTLNLFVANYNSGVHKSLNMVMSSDTSKLSGSIDLYIARNSEGVSNQCNLYMPVTEGMDDELNMYMFGTYIMASSVAMYTSGIGVLNNRTNLYIHGF